MRARIVLLVKLAIAIAIVGLLVATDRLSLAPVAAVLAEPAACAAILALGIVIVLLSATRWWYLVRAGGLRAGWVELVRATWVGLFFGTVAPSVIATDIVRYHALRRTGAPRDAVLATLLVDRATGVFALCALAIGLGATTLSSILSPVRVLAAVAVIVILAIGYAVVANRARGPTAVTRLVAACRVLVASPTTSLVAIALGAVAHALKLVALCIIVAVAGPAGASLSDVIAVSPAGLVVEALPLAPGGLGTAHLAFEHLYATRGIAGGAALFNIYFLARLIVCLLGGFAWLAGPRITVAAESPVAPVPAAPRDSSRT